MADYQSMAQRILAAGGRVSANVEDQRQEPLTLAEKLNEILFGPYRRKYHNATKEAYPETQFSDQVEQFANSQGLYRWPSGAYRYRRPE
jgi:hypothetical protein